MNALDFSFKRSGCKILTRDSFSSAKPLIAKILDTNENTNRNQNEDFFVAYLVIRKPNSYRSVQ